MWVWAKPTVFPVGKGAWGMLAPVEWEEDRGSYPHSHKKFPHAGVFWAKKLDISTEVCYNWNKTPCDPFYIPRNLTNVGKHNSKGA